MPRAARVHRSFRHHLGWALFDVALDLALVGGAVVWAMHHLRVHP